MRRRLKIDVKYSQGYMKNTDVQKRNELKKMPVENNVELCFHAIWKVELIMNELQTFILNSNNKI